MADCLSLSSCDSGSGDDAMADPEWNSGELWPRWSCGGAPWLQGSPREQHVCSQKAAGLTACGGAEVIVRGQESVISSGGSGRGDDDWVADCAGHGEAGERRFWNGGNGAVLLWMRGFMSLKEFVKRHDYIVFERLSTLIPSLKPCKIV